MEHFVSSSSFEGSTGIAKIIIDGQIPVPKDFDDPIVELFRPIRAFCAEDVFFTILVNHKETSINCTILPSNQKNLKPDELVKAAKKAMLGSRANEGILGKYLEILEAFFRDEEGLKLFLERVEQAEQSTGELERTKIVREGNHVIKAFVHKNNLEMPSLKKKEALRKSDFC